MAQNSKHELNLLSVIIYAKLADYLKIILEERAKKSKKEDAETKKLKTLFLLFKKAAGTEGNMGFCFGESIIFCTTDIKSTGTERIAMASWDGKASSLNENLRKLFDRYINDCLFNQAMTAYLESDFNVTQESFLESALDIKQTSDTTSGDRKKQIFLHFEVSYKGEVYYSIQRTQGAGKLTQSDLVKLFDDDFKKSITMPNGFCLIHVFPPKLLQVKEGEVIDGKKYIQESSIRIGDDIIFERQNSNLPMFHSIGLRYDPKTDGGSWVIFDINYGCPEFFKNSEALAAHIDQMYGSCVGVDRVLLDKKNTTSTAIPKSEESFFSTKPLKQLLRSNGYHMVRSYNRKRLLEALSNSKDPELFQIMLSGGRLSIEERSAMRKNIDQKPLLVRIYFALYESGRQALTPNKGKLMQRLTELPSNDEIIEKITYNYLYARGQFEVEPTSWSFSLFSQPTIIRDELVFAALKDYHATIKDPATETDCISHSLG